MNLDDIPTPALVLDLGVLKRNLKLMTDALARHPGVVLRPHMKTAKSVEVAKLAAPDFGPVTVSTLAEAEYLAKAGWIDQIYAVGITPQKLERVAAMNAAGARIKIITDDVEMAEKIAAHPGQIAALVEVDCGEHRGGTVPEGAMEVARALGKKMLGTFTHGGHSYAGRSEAQMAEVAEAERAAVVGTAQAMREAGLKVKIVSMGSSPTALYAKSLEGVTEVRAGVYMFGDLFQGQIGTHPLKDIAVTVLASVIGRRPDRGTILLDAGGLAMSKDRSTEATPKDYGFGLMLDIDGQPSFGDAIMRRAYQEHGEVVVPAGASFRIGDKVRVAPNHTCMTVAAHTKYHVVDGGQEVIGVWDRVNHW
jgi:D-serine deaminase-like pyridoxal phosphate-dependent protein